LAIFTSDNGYHWGEHRLDTKRFPYVESVVVPLMIRWPGRIAPRTTDARLVSNVDILPTLLQAARVSPALRYRLDGLSLLSGASRSELLIEYGLSFDAPLIPWSSVRTDTAQFVEWYDRSTGLLTEREYYDVTKDPHQLLNRLRDGIPGNDPDVAAWSRRLAALRACAGSACVVLQR
jgi:arylsulfatase A-like enzyme